jgi:hypothetical protein
LTGIKPQKRAEIHAASIGRELAQVCQNFIAYNNADKWWLGENCFARQ